MPMRGASRTPGSRPSASRNQGLRCALGASTRHRHIRRLLRRALVDGTSLGGTRNWDWAETRIYKERARNCKPYSIECDAAYAELWALPDTYFLVRRTHSERAENSPSFLEAGVAWAVITGGSLPWSKFEAPV